MSDIAPPKRRIDSTVVYQNSWITVHEDTTVSAAGNEGIYGYIESADSVVIIAVNDNQEVYFHKAFRYPTTTWAWELPGGGGDGEQVIPASQRELEEETGILATDWEILGKTTVCNGLLTEQMTTCLARSLSFDGTEEDSDEVFLDNGFFSLEAIDAMIAAGEINDGQTITALYLYKQQLAKETD